MLKQGFKARMKSLLGGEYDAFIAKLECEEPVRGARENLIKSKGIFSDIPGYKKRPLEYVDNGYILDSADKIGLKAEHHSGMIYMQDPGAMSAVSALDIKSDWLAADLCAAPGGKSSQIAERIPNGFLLSNEYVPKRAKILVSNLERLGVRNALVLSRDVADISQMYKGIFNLVVVDAPCSGEGMFRKSSDAVDMWSEENVIASAKRQSEILSYAKELVADGGYLLYSTCTYSLEENEMNVDTFLEENPDFILVPVKDSLKASTKDGITYEGARHDMTECRRFYPHISEGEGQFIALMKRENHGVMPTILYKDAAKSLKKDEDKILDEFLLSTLITPPCGRRIKIKDRIYILPFDTPIPENQVYMSGVLVGEVIKGVLHPSHQFFSAYGNDFKIKENLTGEDPRVEKFLRGEEIASVNSAGRGYVAVCYHGVSIGGGKLSGGRIKNHYPKGLRNP